MPITSQQVGQMIGGQQAMFGNYASYANQISPGMMGYGQPLYTQPPMGPPPTFQEGAYNLGPAAMGGMAAGLPAAAGLAMTAGAFLPGMAGRAFGALDPFSAGLRGFGASSGLTSGLSALQGFADVPRFAGGMMSNFGRIASGGVGNIARAGLAGIGGAAGAAFLPAMAMMGVQYAGGQMAQGAQFTHSVQNLLGQHFRHLNPQAGNQGYGFSREEGRQIADTVRSMSHRDVMTSPQELLRVMDQGIQGGMFRAVQDAKTFQNRFKEMVGTLKEVAKTMNTTLEGAMPFLQESRRMGFWTPADIQRGATIARGAAASSGISVAEAHQMMGQGASMARRIGAVGASGARGMARSLGMVGWGMRSGTFSEQELSEATGGLIGPEAVTAFAGSLQAGATRFASSGRARWLLAAMANRDMGSLDPGRLRLLTSGQMRIGDIRNMAEGRVRGNAAQFVLNEQNLRGQLLEQGPEAQMGFMRTLIGDKRLFSEDSMSQLITRKLIERHMGVSTREADIIRKKMRELPQIMRDKERAMQAQLDQDERNRENLMDRSWEGLKRKLSKYWDDTVGEPLQKVGSNISHRIGSWWEETTDRMWGRAPRNMRYGGFDAEMTQAVRSAALGDTREYERTFGTNGTSNIFSSLGDIRSGGESQEVSFARAFSRSLPGALFDTARMQLGSIAGLVSPKAADWISGAPDVTNAGIEAFRAAGVSEHAYNFTDSSLVRGAIRSGRGLTGMRREDVLRTRSLYGAASGGVLDTQSAESLGFATRGQAREAIHGVISEGGFGEEIEQGIAKYKDSGMSTKDIAERVVSDIRSGRVSASEKLKRLVGTGTVQQASMSLMAAQSSDTRKGIYGLDVSEEFAKMSAATGDYSQSSMAVLGTMRNKAIDAMAGIYDEADKKFDADAVKEFSEDPTFKRAMSIMWDASRTTDPKDRAAKEAKARSILHELAKTAPENVQRSLVAMASGNNPAANAQMVDLGRINQSANNLRANEVIKRRMSRGLEEMRKSGLDLSVAADMMNEVGVGSDKQSLGIGDKVEDLLKSSDLREFQERSAVLTNALSGVEDPKALAAMISDFTDKGLPPEIMGLMTRMETGKAANAVLNDSRTSWSGRNVVGDFNNILRNTGFNVSLSPEEIKALQSGDEDKRQKVLDKFNKLGDKASESQRENLQRLLTGISEKDASMVGVARERASAAVAATDFATRSQDVYTREDFQKEAGALFGQEGTPKAQHATLRQMAMILSNIDKNIAKGSDTGKGFIDEPAKGPLFP